MRTSLTLMLVIALASFTLACEEKEKAKDPAATAEAAASTTEATKEEAKKEDPGAAAKKEDVKKEEVIAKVGAAAPDFTLTDDAGKEHKLSDYKGKIVVLEWTNPTCPYVVRHYDAKTMTTTAGKGGDEVVWLAIDSSNFVKAEEAKAWRDKHGIEYPILLDPAGDAGRTYAAKTTPHMFVIDKEGMVRYSGAIDNDPRGDKKDDITNYVSTAIDSLKAGKEVETSETKPYGCSVKYGS